MDNRLVPRAGAVAACLLVLSVCETAFGGGVFASDRGTRPLGRGGAFVAGADDLESIYYNPAGIVHASRQILADAELMFVSTEFTRSVRVSQADPNTGEPTGVTFERTYPTSKGSGPKIPIPLLAVSYDFGINGAAFALGAWTPMAAVPQYDVLVDGKPNPGRYMLLSLKGSALIVPGVWAAYKIIPALSVGAGFEMMLGNIVSESAMTGCVQDRFLCATEDPDYDFNVRMTVGPVISPSGNIGVQFDPHENVRVGLSFQAPFYIHAATTSHGRIPSAALFEKAYQDGDQAWLDMKFPWVARSGIELRWPKFKAEASFVYEAWSMHDEASITPEDIVYRDVTGLSQDYRVSKKAVPRNFKDTWSVRLGGEGTIKVGSRRLDLRAGALYEPSAIHRSYLSTVTMDLDKVIASIGASFHLSDRYRFDVMVAQSFSPETTVSVAEARFELISQVRANDTDAEFRDYVNAGKYKSSATMLGVGFAANY